MLAKHEQDDFLKTLAPIQTRYHDRWMQFRFGEVAGALLIAALVAYAGYYQKSQHVDPKDPNASAKQDQIANRTLAMTTFSAFCLTIMTTFSPGAMALKYRTARNEVRALRLDVLESKVTTRAALERRLDDIENKKGEAVTAVKLPA